MSANKDDSGFIEYVKSVYPEIDIQIVPYRGANTTQYMFDQLHTGHMPDIYSTTQMFTCYDKYPEHLKNNFHCHTQYPKCNPQD